MKYLRVNLFATVRLPRKTSYLPVLVCLTLAGGTFQAPETSAVAQTGCGTMDSAFGEDGCLRVSFDGEISASQTFRRRLGDQLLFRLNPESALSGWIVEIVPAGQADGAGNSEYVWVVNPPYRSYNARYIDTSYGTSAKEAVGNSPRDFNFVLSGQQLKRASELVEMAIMSHPQSDTRSKEELDKESNAAIEALGTLSVAKGRLTIVNSRVAPSAGEDGLGSIEWLKFKVELHVPCGFLSGADSSEVSVDRSRCTSEQKQSQK